MKPRKTKYRIRQNGFGRKWLEYHLGRWWNVWNPVPVPYCSKVYIREFADEYNGWLAGREEFDYFIEKYPDIRVYLKEYEIEQDKLEKKNADLWVDYYKRKDSIVKEY